MNFWLGVFLACVFLAAVVNGWVWLARRRNRRREHAPIRNCSRSWPGKPVDGRPLDRYEVGKLMDAIDAWRDDKETV